jgi:hypothetical protein
LSLHASKIYELSFSENASPVSGISSRGVMGSSSTISVGEASFVDSSGGFLHLLHCEA